MSDFTFGLIGASYVAASRMMPAFQANGVPTQAFSTPRNGDSGTGGIATWTC